ncbi:PqqD family protein [Sphingomonas qomolangmaensis]|uniref:PqqD family protein n=1 Tax=Sphingomonas qomolangmaensis TaxID=2918765 RepID=A0ABY5L5Z6_9SPHN|nr:PqqD family protein [Sphingomonas qomolangmaensis]UUL82378.1 PqqD family protein [Sphingomonas qomolangmaensis]
MARARYVANKDVVTCELDSGQALLNLRTSQYVKFNETAGLVWQWVQDGLTVDQMADQMCTMFDAERNQCSADIALLLGQLKEAGLVELEAE